MRIINLLLLTAIAAAIGAVLLVLECALLSIPVAYKKPFGIGSWLLDVYVFHYGIPVTVIFILTALMVAVIMAVPELVRRCRVSKN